MKTILLLSLLSGVVLFLSMNDKHNDQEVVQNNQSSQSTDKIEPSTPKVSSYTSENPSVSSSKNQEKNLEKTKPKESTQEIYEQYAQQHVERQRAKEQYYREQQAKLNHIRQGGVRSKLHRNETIQEQKWQKSYQARMRVYQNDTPMKNIVPQQQKIQQQRLQMKYLKERQKLNQHKEYRNEE